MPAFLGELRGRALWIVLGCLVCQLGLGYGYVFGPLLRDITEDLGLSRAAFSSARVATTFALALASPLVGYLVLRTGTRPVLVASTLLVAVTFAWLSRAQGLADLYVGYALLGLFTTGLGDIVVGGVVAQWVTRARGLALGIVYTGSNLGAILFVQVATFMALHQSWRVALLTIGVGGAAAILPFAAWVVRDRHSGGTSPAPARVPGPEATGEGDLSTRQALRTRSFWILVLALLVFFLYFLAILEHFVAALEDGGTPKSVATTWFSIAIGMGLVSKVGMGAFADRVSARRAFFVNHALLTLSAWLLLVLPAPGVLPLFVALFGFSYAARDVVYPLIIAECFGVRYLPPIYGLLMMVLLPASAGGIFAGWCFDRYGSYDLAFLSFAVLNTGVVASLFLLRRERV